MITNEYIRLYIENNFYTIIQHFSSIDEVYKLTNDVPESTPLNELTSYSIFQVDDNLDSTSNYDAFTQILNEKDFKEWTFSAIEGIVYKEYTVSNLSFSEKVNQLINELARIRYEHETMGIEVNNVKIYSDRNTQSMLSSAVILMDEQPDIIIDWKCEDGWVQLDKNTISTISQCLAHYVQACFTNEKTLVEMLKNIPDNDWDALENFDLFLGWPSNIYNI